MLELNTVCNGGCVRYDGKMLLFIHQDLEKTSLIGIANQVDASLQFFCPFENPLAFFVQYNGVNDRVCFTKIMPQVDILILERFKGHFDLVTILCLSRSCDQQ